MPLLFSGTSHKQFASGICKRYKFTLGECEIKQFSCGETYIKLGVRVRGERCYIMQTITARANDDFMEIFLLADALRRHDASEIIAIIPHFGYARQDRRAVMGEPISVKLIADLLVSSGVTSVITFDLHSDQIEGFFGIPVDNLHCYELFADYFAKKKLRGIVVVAPDAGAAKMARRLAVLLKAPIAILHKRRPAHHQVEHTHIVGDIEGKTAILFDDMIDTGGTTAASYSELIKHGAREVYAAVTHPVFSGPAYDRLSQAGFKEIVVTDTIPLAKKMSNVKVLSAVGLLKKVL